MRIEYGEERSNSNCWASFLCKRDFSFIVVPVELLILFAFVFAPSITRMGQFDKKAIRFPGTFELCYLHPNRFKPDPTIFNDLCLRKGERYSIIRLSALQAHHDTRIRGIKEELLREVIKLTNGDVRLFITSEKPISDEFEQYRLRIKPERIHHALYYAQFYLGDSQTMAAESAVLGTPAFRINDFVDRISYLSELEGYKLAFGFKPGHENKLLSKLSEIIAMPNVKQIFESRREKMLSEKKDPLLLFMKILNMFYQNKPLSEIKMWSIKKGRI